MAGIGWAKCPGTCGEWIQGAQNGVPFLIGCPINRFVEAEAELSFWSPMDKRDMEWIWQLPTGKEKTRQALEGFARSRNLPNFTAAIRMKSQLQIGKGMASSTADMAAAVVALAYAGGVPWEPEELVQLLLKIEPTDPIMFPGVTEFAHRDGSYVKLLGPQIPARLLMLDWGGILDTQAFNARRDLPGHYRKNEQNIKSALSLFYEGLDQRDLEKIAGASTISARCNQEINQKTHFEDFLAWTVSKRGLGVLAAHSGTMLAGIFPDQISQTEQKIILRESRAHFRPDRVEWLKTYDAGIKGGVEVARWKLTGSQGTVWETNLY